MVAKQIHVLKNHGYVGQKTVAGKFFKVVPAHGYASALRVVKPCEKAANGGFAAAGGTDYRGGSLFRDTETYVF